MQQAQVNLLADMGAHPGSLMSGLVAPTKSTDTTAPTTVITSPADRPVHRERHQVDVTGTASDVGGRVAGVEVSTDGGNDVAPGSRHDQLELFLRPAGSRRSVDHRPRDRRQRELPRRRDHPERRRDRAGQRLRRVPPPRSRRRPTPMPTNSGCDSRPRTTDSSPGSGSTRDRATRVPTPVLCGAPQAPVWQASCSPVRQRRGGRRRSSAFLSRSSRGSRTRSRTRHRTATTPSPSAIGPIKRRPPRPSQSRRRWGRRRPVSSALRGPSPRLHGRSRTTSSTCCSPSRIPPPSESRTERLLQECPACRPAPRSPRHSRDLRQSGVSR